MRVVFLGTPDFAVESLKEIARHHEVVGVVTQPDRPRERGKVTPTPVKEEALRLGLPVFCFEKIRDHVDELRALSPDVMVTVAYGQILNQDVLSVAPKGVINVHASLLPLYRGSAPIQWAVINGDEETGVTIMKTELGVDTGDIILVKRTKIGQSETAGELFDRLAILGSQAITEALELIERGEEVYAPQDHSKATRCAMLKKSDGAIDFSASCRAVHARIRGLTPWPSAYAYNDGECYKLSNPVILEGEGKPGEILVANPRDGLVVACGTGALGFDVQRQGGKKMNIREYLKGHSFRVGSYFTKENDGI